MNRSSPSCRKDFKIFETLTTRWFDNDIYGHMNNTIHYQLFDTAVNGWLMRQDVIRLKHSPAMFLVVETGCRYHAEIAFPDVIHAGLRVDHLGSSSVRYQIGLFRNDDDFAAAEGFFVHVNVDPSTRKPTPMNDHAREILTSLTSPLAKS